MFPQLPPIRVSVPVIRVIGLGLTVTVVSWSRMVLVELLGSIWTLEFMALTGNAGQRNSHDQQGK